MGKDALASQIGRKEERAEPCEGTGNCPPPPLTSRQVIGELRGEVRHLLRKVDEKRWVASGYFLQVIVI